MLDYNRNPLINRQRDRSPESLTRRDRISMKVKALRNVRVDKSLFDLLENFGFNTTHTFVAEVGAGDGERERD
jgi:hypothetical protein